MTPATDNESSLPYILESIGVVPGRISFCGAISKTKLTNKNQQHVRIWLSESEMLVPKFKQTYFSAYNQYALNSKAIILSTFFNGKMMRRGDSCKLGTLISKRRWDSYKSSSLIGEGTHLNQAFWYVRGKGTHVNQAFLREQKTTSSTSLFLGYAKSSLFASHLYF